MLDAQLVQVKKLGKEINSQHKPMLEDEDTEKLKSTMHSLSQQSSVPPKKCLVSYCFVLR